VVDTGRRAGVLRVPFAVAVYNARPMTREATIPGMDSDTLILGNPPIDWLYALGLGLLTFAALLFVRRLVTAQARKYASGTELPRGVRLLSLLVAKTQVFPLLALSLIVGSKYLDLGRTPGRVTTVVIVVMIALQVGIWLSTAVGFFLQEQRLQSHDKNSKTVTTLLRFIANLLIWSLVLLAALSNLGINVTALVTGLGIGGIAVALAVQNILGDLLASVSIALDKPFEVGDFVNLDGGFMGTVEEVGIKSTRLRALSGEQIVVPNSEIVKARIRNMGRLRERRAVFAFGVTYDTTPEQLEEIPRLVRAAIEELGEGRTRFDRAHFTTFGDSQLNFEVVYFVTVPDYLVYMDVQQAVNLRLMREFGARGIRFAFPTQTLVIDRAPRGGAKRAAAEQRAAGERHGAAKDAPRPEGAG
jgi:small-conductance mechanosensitive channel